ncbi:MAG: PadR family transcriptional regulator [Bacteroidetes bacterium]|nr:PadR family transcriptional regulator [Bacteroidota bacterium]
MKLLSRAEEIVLTAILLLKGTAYGVSIREHIFEVTGKKWSFALIYDPLNKLTKKGFITKSESEPTPERGGRRKVYYEITDPGKTALMEIKTMHEGVWEKITNSILETK